MKLISAAICVAAVCAVQLGAQSSETTTKSKVTVKGGKSVTVTGCVERMAGPAGFVLTNVADKSGALHSYALVGENDDLAKHVGHRVMVEGHAADRGDGKVEIESHTKTKVEDGKDQEWTQKSQMSGQAAGMAYMDVGSVKMVAASCP